MQKQLSVVLEIARRGELRVSGSQSARAIGRAPRYARFKQQAIPTNPSTSLSQSETDAELARIVREIAVALGQAAGAADQTLAYLGSHRTVIADGLQSG